MKNTNIMHLGNNQLVMKKIIILSLIAAVLLSSCATIGYGCKGVSSWNGVVRKANKLY